MGNHNRTSISSLSSTEGAGAFRPLNKSRQKEASAPGPCLCLSFCHPRRESAVLNPPQRSGKPQPHIHRLFVFVFDGGSRGLQAPAQAQSKRGVSPGLLPLPFFLSSSKRICRPQPAPTVRVAHSSRNTSRDEWGTPTFNPQAVAVASLSVILEGNLLHQPPQTPHQTPTRRGTASEPVLSEVERTKLPYFKPAQTS